MLSGHDQEAGFTGQRLCRSIGISVLPYMAARHAVAHKVNPRKLPSCSNFFQSTLPGGEGKFCQTSSSRRTGQWSLPSTPARISARLILPASRSETMK